MSTLAVNTIQAQTGSTVSVPTGQILTAQGHVIQMVDATGGTQTAVTANNTWVATNASVSITPKFNNSKIYLSHTAGGLTYAGTGDRGLRIQRAITGGATTVIHQSNRYGYVGTGNWVPMNWSVIDVDTGYNTTNQITYTIEIYKGGTGGEARHCDDATWTFVATEIAQ